MKLKDRIEELEARLAKQNLVLEGYKLLAGLSDPDPFKVQRVIEEQLKKVDEESPAKDWLDTLKKDPKKIIAWAKREIKAYQELIKLLEEK